MSTSRVFVDRAGRRIVIDDHGDDVIALHEGKKIGRIGVDHHDEGPILWSADVKPEYQRAGIATEMMKLVAELHGRRIGKPVLNAVGGSQAEAHTYYTEEGAALVRRCLRDSILDDTEPRESDA